MPLISKTSSPSCNSPLFSAAPPLTIRLMMTESISLRTVAPCVVVTNSVFIKNIKLKAIYCMYFKPVEEHFTLKENAINNYNQCLSLKKLMFLSKCHWLKNWTVLQHKIHDCFKSFPKETKNLFERYNIEDEVCLKNASETTFHSWQKDISSPETKPGIVTSIEVQIQLDRSCPDSKW